MTAPDHRTEDWQPTRTVVLAWNVLGVTLSLTGIVLFAAIYALTHGGEASARVGPLVLLISMAIFVLLLVVHEWIHGLAMRWYGARPEYGVGLYKNVMPYLSCTSPGHGFTRGQFAAVSVAPLVVISLVGALWVAFVPFGGWLAVPVGAHLGGCIGDIWFLGIMARLPRGTILEDLVTGVRIMRPAVWASLD